MKKVLCILALLLVCVTLFAQGSKDDAKTDQIAGSKISVLATNYTDKKVEVFNKLIDQFEAESGVKVDVITPGGDSETQLKTMMASNALPDVFMTHGWSLLRYSEYLEVVNSQSWFNTMDLDSLGGVMKDENGNFYALGMSMSVSGLIYNKDALDKAGVDPNSIRTWAAFEDASDKLLAVGITPLVIGGSVGGNLAGLLGNIAPTFWTDEGAKYDLKAELLNGTFNFDTYATELYQYLASWMKKGYINEDVLTLDAAGAQRMLGAGEAAFMVRGTDNITIARQYYPNANMGVLPLPSSANGAPSFKIGEGDAWGVSKTSKNKAACWALLAYLARPEVGTEWSTVSGTLPTIAGASAADSYAIDCYRKAVTDTNGFVQYDNLFDRKYYPNGMWGIMATSVSLLFGNPDNVKPAVDYLKTGYLELYNM